MIVMKKIYSLFILLCTLCVVSCNKNEFQPESGFYVKASIDNFGTKTSMDGNNVYWEEGDKIALIGEDNNTYEFTLVSGAGTADGTFSPAENYTETKFIAAVYPYNESIKYESNNTITSSLPTTYEWKEGSNNKAPMAALADADGNFSFKNAGALIALTVNNIPQGYNKIQLLSDGGSISGKATLTFEDGIPAYSIEDTDESESKMITINFTASTESSDKTFYFPLGVMDPFKATFTLNDGSKNITLLSSYQMKTISRNVRYYKTINLDSEGKPSVHDANENTINESITNEGSHSFVLNNEVTAAEITATTGKEILLEVTSSNGSFKLSGEGPTGNVLLCTPSQTKNLTIQLPNATVEINPLEGFATYSSITASTAENTLIIPKGVVVEDLYIGKGNVKIEGTVNNIHRTENNTDNLTKIYLENDGTIKHIDGADINVVWDGETCTVPEYTESTKTYSIKTPAHLAWIAKQVNEVGNPLTGCNVVLENDINLDYMNWTPIGSPLKDHGFCGNFDGQNYTIRNLKINQEPYSDGYAYVGLFGITENNSIKNLVIENVNISCSGHIVSAAIAYPYYTKVENITVKGNIEIYGKDYTAGILGYTRRCYYAKDLTISGSTGSTITGNITVGGVISDIQTNGGGVNDVDYFNFSASGLTITASKCLGGISGIICNQTLDGATVKNISLVSNDSRTGIVSGALGGTSTIKNITSENVQVTVGGWAVNPPLYVAATYDGAKDVIVTIINENEYCFTIPAE